MIRATMIVALLALTACGSSPAAPTPVIPQLTGQYAGTYTTTTCTETGAATGSGYCNSVRFGGGMVYTPQQNGSTLSGTLSMGGLQGIPVSGSIDASGTAVLTGSGPVNFGATLNLTSWRGTLSGQSIAGTTQFTIATTDPIGAAVISGTFAVSK